MKRASGVLMHISSLWGDYSCGSFGAAAREFVDFLVDCGFSYWQVLPFCITDDCNSPYKSYSAFAGNPYFVDLDILAKKGLITPSELDRSLEITPYSCEFDRLSHTRLELLRRAAERVEDKGEIRMFMKKHPQLESLARFMAIRAKNSDAPWYEWKNDTELDEDILFTWEFIQYEFFTQWQSIKSYANSKGIKIIGDIPIYVSLDSSDVWSGKENFLLDEDGRPTAVAGVPPDYFSEDGQLWGNPLYNWDKMKADGYAWWLSRMDYMLSMFDGVRIDHFRAFESYFSIPYGAKSAKEGHWEKGPDKDFIDKLRAKVGDRLIIAEDLGDITPEVLELVKHSGFPGMRVLQFGFLNDGDSPHKPHNYSNNTVAYTGTHDNNTLLGYVWELDDNTRREILSYCGYYDKNWDRGYDSIVRTMLSSHAGLVILPIQDLLGYGSDTRLNVPGKAKGNWQYRITREQLMSINREKYRRWNKIYSR